MKNLIPDTEHLVNTPCGFCKLTINRGDKIFVGLYNQNVGYHKNCFELLRQNPSEELKFLKGEGWVNKDTTIEDLIRKPMFDPRLEGRR